MFLCLYANRCEPGAHPYQFYCIQSTFSPILKSLVPWGHLVGGYLSLHCGTLYYFETTFYQNLFLICFIFSYFFGTFRFETCCTKQRSLIQNLLYEVHFCPKSFFWNKCIFGKNVFLQKIKNFSPDKGLPLRGSYLFSISYLSFLGFPVASCTVL